MGDAHQHRVRPNEVTALDAASPVCLHAMVRGRGTGEFFSSA